MRKLIRLGRRMDGDDGATLVIVALCLIALFGMLVLVVDVGGLLLNRREMVNASDAAALSAAKSCILKAAEDPLLPEDAADRLASENTPKAKWDQITNIKQISAPCKPSGSTGYVTVQYSADQHLFFAPVLGAGSTGAVTTQATAVWAPAGAANPLPIVLYQNSFHNCKLGLKEDPPQECFVWEDNNNVSDSQNAFGLLDLRTDDPTKYGWDSNPGVGCSAPGNGINGPQGWIQNYPDPNIGDLPVHYPSPTYVCRIPGFQQSTWAELDRLKDDDDSVDNNDQEDIVYFPINRCENTVPNTNIGGQLGPNSTQEVACASTPGQYDIIGFAAMKIEDILRKGDPGVNGATGSCPNNATLGLAGAGAYNKGGWSLDSIATVQCGAPSTPATITNVVVSSGQGNNATTYTQCPPTPPPGNSCDYVWDDSTHQLSWFKDSTRNGADAYNINFTWTLPGRCGIPPSSSASGHCLILLPVDVQIGTGFGQGSPDSNVLAAKLCDPAIAGSCAPVVVPPVP